MKILPVLSKLRKLEQTLNGGHSSVLLSLGPTTAPSPSPSFLMDTDMPAYMYTAQTDVGEKLLSKVSRPCQQLYFIFCGELSDSEKLQDLE